MKQGIHPEYYQATVTCNCGNTFVTGSTNKDIHVEICSKCHPFYTGQQKAAQARGRVDKFNKKYGMGTVLISSIRNTEWVNKFTRVGLRFLRISTLFNLKGTGKGVL